MTETPEDIMDVSRGVYNEWQASNQRSSTLERIIARALMAERLASEARGREKQKEADARIAEERADLVPANTKWFRAYQQACKHIASLIRK